LLKELNDTKDPDRRRSIASSTLGIANALEDFKAAQKLLDELITLSRSEKEASRWQAELDGLYERIAKHVSSEIVKLKFKYAHLEKFSTAEHLIQNGVRNNFAPGTPGNPELYSISYSNGLLASEPPSKTGPRRAPEVKFDPKTGIQLNVHFFKGDSRGNDLSPAYRIGELGVHVYVKGPAAEPIRREIDQLLEDLGAAQGPWAATTGNKSALPWPAHPPTSSGDNKPSRPPGASYPAPTSPTRPPATDAADEPRRESTAPAPPSATEPPLSNDRPAETAGFSETKELVLSMNSSKFMLDLDTGQTMDPPATIGRSEQGKMDVYTTQVQPYHYPTGLVGYSLQGREVKASEWNASVDDVRRALAGEIYPLKEMDIGPEITPTYFFKTRDGAMGILQLVGVTDEPKGIRLRYKTVLADSKTDSKTASDRPAEAPRADKPKTASSFELRLASRQPTEGWSKTAVADGGEVVYVSNKSLATAADVASAEAIDDPAGQPALHITFTSEAATRLGHATDLYRGQPLAIVVEGRVLAAPVIRDPIISKAVMVGNLSQRETRRIAELLSAKTRGATRFERKETIERVAISGDGRQIAIANGNPTFILQTSGTSRLRDNWRPSSEILDAETGATVAALQLSTAEEDAILAATEAVFHFEVTALAFSPVEDVIAVGTSIGQVKLFNAKTGELVRLLDDQKSRFSDKETPENWKPMQRALGRVESLAFSPDGSLLAVCGKSFADFSDVFDRIENGGLGRHASGPGRLKVYDVKTGSLKHDLADHSQAFSVAFSSDGSLLASAGRWEDSDGHGNGVIIWNPTTGEKVRAIQIEANGGTHYVAFAPDKKLIVTGSVRFDKENDTASTSVAMTYPLSGITEWAQTFPGWSKPAFTPDGESVVVLCGRESVRVVNAQSGQLKHEIKAANSSPGTKWTDFAISRHSNQIAVGGRIGNNQGTLSILKLDTAAQNPP
jgi:WD40 repeat protein